MKVLPAFAVLLLATAGATSATLPEETPVRVTVELMGGPDGTPDCAAGRTLATNETWAWATVLAAGEHGASVECLDDAAAAAAMGDRVIRVETTLRTPSPPQDPHLVVEVSSRAEGGETQTRQRQLYFWLDDAVLIPAVTGAEGPPGGRDLLVRVRARPDSEPDIAYSTLNIVSGSAGARILLDGGVVGTVDPKGVTTVQHVPVGEHRVSLQADSGRGMTRTVQVHRGRQAMLALEMEQPEVPGFGLEPLGRNAQGHEEFLRPRDGAVVIRIPSGEFLMGNKETERTPLEHTVFVSEFLIDKTEVTFGQYKRFLAATGGSLPPIEPYWGIHDDHAAVFVDWEEAKAHCEWSGGRLATEAEWEKAARGTDGRKFPWGNSEPTRELAVHRRGWGFTATDPATAHPDAASPYGALDMGGSLWEWCADWYDGGYYEVSPRKDPRGPTSGLAHVVRGGSWDSRPDVLSASCRSWGHRGYREGDFGFRCAMDSP